MPFQNYSNFDQTYFERNSVSNPHPAGYSTFDRSILPFGDYSQKIRDELEAAGQNINQTSVLIVGCGYGHTVHDLVTVHNIDAWGMDISSWAVSQAPGNISDRIIQGDVVNSSDLQNVRQTKGGGRFNVILGEEILSTMTDSEAVTAGENMRSESQDMVLWRVWATNGSDLNENEYNAKTMDQWRSLVDPDDEDVWFSEKEFQP